VSGHGPAASPGRFTASEAHECKQRAEDEDRSSAERLVWAVLAVAAELHTIRKEQRRESRRGR
jgi:hypothetical protein